MPDRLPDLVASQYSAGALLQLFRDDRPHTRSELAQVTGWSRSTIIGRIEQLCGLNLVRPHEDGRSTGGRPPAQFILDASSRLVLGVDLGVAHASVGVTDLAGTVLGTRRTEMEIREGPSTVLDWVQHEARQLLDEITAEQGSLLGVGVGVPGAVDVPAGRVVSSLVMPGWDNYPVGEHLRAELGVPVTVDNDVNVLAIAEHRWTWPQVQNLLFVKAASGIGSGIIAGGSIQRGALGAAGDLGHFVADPTSEEVCPCGNRGCLEALASATALKAKLLGDGTLEQLFELARAGDPHTAQCIRESARLIGAVVGSAVSLLNPSVVVIGGSLVGAGQPFLAGVREAIYQTSVPLASRDLVVVESTMGPMGGIRGASALSIDYALSARAIDEYLEQPIGAARG